MGRKKSRKKQSKEELLETFRKRYKRRDVIVSIESSQNSSLFLRQSFFSWEKKDKILIICPPILKKEYPDEYEDIMKEVITENFNDDHLIFKHSKKSILEAYSSYKLTGTSKEIIEFFSDKLHGDDVNALRMSLFLRYQSNNNKRVDILKNDIREKYGERGANIANLCSAGYFENEFKPLYNSVPRKEFEEYYEAVVEKKARALFVHAQMGVEELRREFFRLLDRAKKYRLKDFRIHGKGEVNVNTIKALFNELKEEGPHDDFEFEKNENTKIQMIEYEVKLIN